MNERLQPGLHGAFLAAGFANLPTRVAFDDAPGLIGTRLAVKDVFDIAGLATGAGNPDWLRGQSLAHRNATAVARLLAQGCDWVGKTVTDELTYSLAGINAHYGTPINPAAPGRLPGGSSSGSAVAVAGGHADLALGTDCGGSVRLPASYCGLWGIRPTHGRVPSDGCFVLAADFDTVGWFAREARPLGLALEALLQCQLPEPPTSARLLVSDDVLAQLDEPVRNAFEHWLNSRAVAHDRLPIGTLPLETWARAFRTLQARQVWQQHGTWVRDAAPCMGRDVAERFTAASRVTVAEEGHARDVRQQANAQLIALLASDRMLLLPPVPGAAPRLDATFDEVDDTRQRSQRLLCMAGLAGLPQVTMPWQRVDGAPVGLSLIGARSTDEHTFATARWLHQRFIRPMDGAL